MAKSVNKGGRPTDYDPSYCDKVDEYLEQRQDEDVQIVKQSNSEKGYEMYDTKLKVKLPTVEGFAIFIGVSKKTLYNWEKEHEEFLHALEKIREEQHKRLIDMGLSGDYNPAIAKLVLSSNHGYKERTDQTTNDKDLPTPILGNVQKNNGNGQDNSNEGKA